MSPPFLLLTKLRHHHLLTSGLFIVTKTAPGGPAAQSGQVLLGDVVAEVNGQTLEGLSIEAVSSFGPQAALPFHVCSLPAWALPGAAECDGAAVGPSVCTIA